MKLVGRTGVIIMMAMVSVAIDCRMAAAQAPIGGGDFGYGVKNEPLPGDTSGPAKPVSCGAFEDGVVVGSKMAVRFDKLEIRSLGHAARVRQTTRNGAVNIASISAAGLTYTEGGNRRTHVNGACYFGGYLGGPKYLTTHGLSIAQGASMEIGVGLLHSSGCGLMETGCCGKEVVSYACDFQSGDNNTLMFYNDLNVVRMPISQFQPIIRIEHGLVSDNSDADIDVKTYRHRMIKIGEDIPPSDCGVGNNTSCGNGGYWHNSPDNIFYWGLDFDAENNPESVNIYKRLSNGIAIEDPDNGDEVWFVCSGNPGGGSPCGQAIPTPTITPSPTPTITPTPPDLDCNAPIDQGTWTPSCVSEISFSYNSTDSCGEWVQAGQWFMWDDQQLQGMLAYNAYFQFEIRRDEEYIDYWHCQCGQSYWTNLPGNSSEYWSEEDDPPWCWIDRNGQEEFELKHYEPNKILADTWYGVYALFTWDEVDFSKVLRLTTEGELCGKWLFCDLGDLFKWAKFSVFDACFGPNC
jgi:hypothetical protein